MKTLVFIVGWCLLLVLCWPLAILTIVLWPFVWLLALPFRLVGIVCRALLALVFAIQVGPLWYPTPDAISYLSIARSIALDHVAANHGGSQLYYSIGYPLLISPVFLLDERPFLFLSLVHFLWAIVLILSVYCWARRCVRHGRVRFATM